MLKKGELPKIVVVGIILLPLFVLIFMYSFTIEFYKEIKETGMGRYLLWKTFFWVAFFIWIFSSEYTYYDRLPFFVIISQLFSIETVQYLKTQGRI